MGTYMHICLGPVWCSWFLGYGFQGSMLITQQQFGIRVQGCYGVISRPKTLNPAWRKLPPDVQGFGVGSPVHSYSHCNESPTHSGYHDEWVRGPPRFFGLATATVWACRSSAEKKHTHTGQRVDD